MRRLLVLLMICLPFTGISYAQSGAIPITYGDTVQGSITDDIPTLTYSFTGQQGDRIEVSVTSGGTLDPFVTLSSNTGALLNSDDNSAGAPNALLTTSLPGTGTYFLSVSRSPAAIDVSNGDFTMVLSAEPVNTIPPSSSGTTDPVTTVTVNTEERLQIIPLNSTVQGTFTTDAPFNVYWFEGTAGKEIALQPNLTADVSPLLVLYRSDLSEIVRAQPGDSLTATLDRTDLYFIAAANLEASTAGRYGFDLIDRSAEPTVEVSNDVLIYGQTKNGIISNTNAVNRYRFQAEAGDLVSIEMTSTEGDLDSYLILLNAGGATLVEDDNSGGGTNARIGNFSIPASGEYFVIATRIGQETGITTGSFDLVVQSSAPPRVPENSAPDLPDEYVGLPQINYGETVRGTVNNEAFLNIYVFYGEAGDVITASMTADDTSLDPLLILLDRNRIPLAENDDIEDGVIRDSELTFTLESDGYYALVATRFEQAEGTSSGGYSINLTSEGLPDTIDPDSPLLDRLTATTLNTGETPSAEFQPLSLGRLYTFPAAEGTLIDFSVTADDQQQVTLILTDGSLRPVADSNNSVLLAIPAPRTDQYFVLVVPGPARNAEGSYFVALNIEVDDGSGGETPIEITYGNTVNARITDNTSARRYTFRGSEGDIVEITMTAADTLDTLLRLFGPDEELIQENDDIDPGVVRNSRIQVTLPASGMYTIVATRYEGTDATATTGDFTLSLASQDPTTVGVDQQAEDITYGETVSGEITADSFLKFYFFVGRQGDRIAISVNTTQGNLDAILYLYTFTSDNEPFLLVANDDSPRGGTYNPYIEYTLPRGGPYLIGVTRFADEDTEPTNGSFTLSVELLETPGAQ